jgi:SulP family sulfate permease
MNNSLRNHFKLSEWSGAIGDLGITLPMAFALVVFNGFPPERIFFLWGMVYIITGWYYKVPVAVQPLKAMAVIAIASGYSAELLSTTSFFYGVLLIGLSVTGMIHWLEKWFSIALIRGIQLGLGLILAQKAIMLTFENGVFLNQSAVPTPIINAVLFAFVMIILWYFQFRKQFPIVLVIIPIGILVSLFLDVSFELAQFVGPPISVALPKWMLFTDGLLYLIIPQLPLTLGNAVFSASNVCHMFWKERAERVNPTRLGFSIGVSNLVIGLFGGFPICHGSGGMTAHAQFGGKTGGTTIILGSIFVAIALINPISMFLFFIPIPILGTMLLIVSYRLMLMIQTIQYKSEMVVAVLVGITSFVTRNLSIAVIVGILAEFVADYCKKHYVLLDRGNA